MDIGVDIIKSCNGIVAGSCITISNLNIAATAEMVSVMAAQNSNVVNNNAFAVKVTMSPVARILGGIAREIEVAAILSVYSVRTSVMFLAVFIITVLTVYSGTLFADYANILGRNYADKSVVPVVAG